jgi:uncharacterized surface protein with fasciclin (FAS1) repeats
VSFTQKYVGRARLDFAHKFARRLNIQIAIAREAHSSRITIADVMQSNGVIQVVDTVVLPN